MFSELFKNISEGVFRCHYGTGKREVLYIRFSGPNTEC